MLWCTQPIFKIVTVVCLSSRPCSACTRFYKSSLLTADIRGRSFKRLQPKSGSVGKDPEFGEHRGEPFDQRQQSHLRHCGDQFVEHTQPCRNSEWVRRLVVFDLRYRS